MFAAPLVFIIIAQVMVARSADQLVFASVEGDGGSNQTIDKRIEVLMSGHIQVTGDKQIDWL